MVDTVQKKLHSRKGPLWVSRSFSWVSYLLVCVAKLISYLFVPVAKLAVFIALIGLLIKISAPHDYDRTYGKIQEGVALSNPHRTAIGIACVEETLGAGLPTDELGLAAPSEYQGTYVNSVSAEVESDTKARVVIVYKQIGREHVVIQDGATVVYTGTCGPTGISWEISGTVPKKYLPKYLPGG